MTELTDWLVALPYHIGQMGTWLVTPFSIGDFSATPLACLGASFGAFVAVLLVLKIKSLILA